MHLHAIRKLHGPGVRRRCSREAGVQCLAEPTIATASCLTGPQLPVERVRPGTAGARPLYLAGRARFDIPREGSQALLSEIVPAIEETVRAHFAKPIAAE
jgi:hypothetical protein